MIRAGMKTEGIGFAEALRPAIEGHSQIAVKPTRDGVLPRDSIAPHAAKGGKMARR